MNRIKTLPQDIRASIYSFLPVRDVKTLFSLELEDENTLYLYVCKQIKKNQRNVFRNMILSQCFKCDNQLESEHVINVCSFCRFYFDKIETFPMYCHKCYKLKDQRDFDFRNCIMCKHYSAVLGVVPYS